MTDLLRPATPPHPPTPSHRTPSSSLPAAAPPHLHITRDPRHGVTLYAQRLADALTSAELADHSAGPGRIHLHFTDRLWGSDPESAADAIEEIARRGPVTVTLHDLPQPSDGMRGLARRARCYRRVVAAASGVVCNSRHEADLLARYTDPSIAPAVIPLPVDAEPLPATTPPPAPAPSPTTASTRPRPHPTRSPRVSVLGYVYPGKGHDRTIRAVAALDRWPRVVVEALGRASDGHERDLESIRRIARHSAVALEVSGFLPDAELLARCRLADVPVIAHQHVSASGSLATWLGAGRRPLVLRSPYMEEMAELHRGALTLVSARDLPGAIGRALDDPGSTWLEGRASLGPTLAETAARYRSFWDAVPW
ncbi:glycosyltransferase [Herbiconiux solani]|uniref:glycosyltransferase n=1 Tax=Herbiconiux solani TaxID=661329 RepID=UPI000824470C|nr:glycosyltransferase [Herbiconiux solani]